MKTNQKKKLALFCIVCILSVLTAGCGSISAPDVKTTAERTGDASTKETKTKDVNDTPPADAVSETKNAVATDTQKETAQGRWHVLEPEVATAVDADFLGTVQHIAEGAFSITETKTMILDDGSLMSSSYSSNADIPDSEIIHVVVDEDTYFYIRTIYGSGERYEDTEADFGALEEHMSVEMRGSFENDVFYASEVRMVKVV